MTTDPMSDTAVAWWCDPPDDAVGALHAARKLAAEVAALRAEGGAINDLRDRLLSDGFRPVVGVLSYPYGEGDVRHTWGVWNGCADDDLEPVTTGATIAEALAATVRTMGMEP